MQSKLIQKDELYDTDLFNLNKQTIINNKK